MSGKAGFKKWNLILGWFVFAVALATYTLTMEKTASLWDCGEFISGAYKLEIVHPPGAPIFILFGRIFTLFAFGNLQLVADMVNFMSALSTAFVALFGFWSITMLAAKLLLKTDDDYTTPNILATLGAGLVGGLSITFLDSLWFSAVEGEVYALSMFFMTFIVWAALRWDKAEGVSRDRWFMTIAFATGLSLGVHLLSMLVIPFFGLVYYFNRYKKHNLLGGAVAIGVSFVVIGFIMKGIISGIPTVFGLLERIFVNGMGAPFNTGVFVGLVGIIAAVLFALYYTRAKQNRELQTFVLSVIFILIGYSTFFTVPIRSSANPPINMNEPDDPLRMLSYLNREQYGVRPLLYGPRYDANPRFDVETEGRSYKTKGEKRKFYKNEEEGRYVELESRGEFVWKDDINLFFPRLSYFPDGKKTAFRHWVDAEYTVEDAVKRKRMQSFGKGENGLARARSYAQQLNQESGDGRYVVRDEIGFVDNMIYFFQYQLGYMYGRYFMWNFSGRQNDKQGTYRNSEGGWLTGIPFLDDHFPIINDMWGNARYPQSKITKARKEEAAYNRFFMIPFILGVIGLIFHFRSHPKAAILVMAAFLSTGMIYLVYANEPPWSLASEIMFLLDPFFSIVSG